MCTGLLLQNSVESQSKSDNEEEEDNEELDEGVEDVGEHNHVDSQLWELLDEQHQVDPAQEDGDGSHRPLPLLVVTATSSLVHGIQSPINQYGFLRR